MDAGGGGCPEILNEPRGTDEIQSRRDQGFAVAVRLSLPKKLQRHEEHEPLMHHDDLHSTLRQSAAVKLLQSQNAPLILSFLVAKFKLKQRVTVPHTELIEHLTAYLEALQESHPGLYGGTAVAYLRLLKKICAMHLAGRRYKFDGIRLCGFKGDERPYRPHR